MPGSIGRNSRMGRVVRDSAIGSLFAVLVGGLSSVLLLREGHAVPGQLDWASAVWVIPVLLAATSVNLAGRFLRWHYLLRRCGVLLPTRESLRVYCSSYAFQLTPLYSGVIAFRALVLLRRRGTPIGVTGSVGVVERVFDAIALLLLAGLTGLAMGRWEALLAVLAAGIVFLAPVLRAVLTLVTLLVMAVARAAFNEDTAPMRTVVRALADRRTAGSAMLLSVGSWVPVAFSLWLAVSATGASIGPPAGAYWFCVGALVGGVSLLPAGVAVTGLTMLDGMAALDVAVPSALAAVAIVRIMTLGVAVVMGVATALWAAWRGEFADTGAPVHFDRVSEVYDAEIPLQVREHLVRRKADLIAAQLGEQNALGIDLGCGRGYYLEELRHRGYRVIGVDVSVRQLRAARVGASAVAADALRLPFADETFDFAYSVNLFHHLTTRSLQREAFREVQRVLKPHGRFFLHEINVANPLFRFYMGYVFPVLRNIDTGVELWLRPAALDEQGGLELRGVCYFTFLPDFLPSWAMRWTRRVERRLENSRWRHLSAHYMAQFERRAEGQ